MRKNRETKKTGKENRESVKDSAEEKRGKYETGGKVWVKINKSREKYTKEETINSREATIQKWIKKREYKRKNMKKKKQTNKLKTKRHYKEIWELIKNGKILEKNIEVYQDQKKI